MFYSIGYFILVESGIAFYHIFPYIIELSLLYSTGKTVSDFFFYFLVFIQKLESPSLLFCTVGYGSREAGLH